jgi:muconolactone delta-isomerase
MTTNVPDRTPDQAVEFMPLDSWMTDETTPLTRHPSDPATVPTGTP